MTEMVLPASITLRLPFVQQQEDGSDFP